MFKNLKWHTTQDLTTEEDTEKEEQQTGATESDHLELHVDATSDVVSNKKLKHLRIPSGIILSLTFIYLIYKINQE